MNSKRHLDIMNAEHPSTLLLYFTLLIIHNQTKIIYQYLCYIEHLRIITARIQETKMHKIFLKIITYLTALQSAKKNMQID